MERTADKGEYRAKYTIPTTGDSKHLQLLVSRLGSGKEGRTDAKLAALLAEFEGEGVASAQRKELKVGAYTVKISRWARPTSFQWGRLWAPINAAPRM